MCFYDSRYCHTTKETLIYAYESNTNDTEVVSETDYYTATTDDEFDISKIEIESEETSKRTEDTKTFRQIDGTYVLAMYNTPVHYLEDGYYIDIDNTLEYEESSTSYMNKENKYSIKLPKTIDDNK